MKILTSEKIREADAYTIRHEPIASVDLMERAARELLRWIMAQYSLQEVFRIFVGPGNNGGDGWALARLLAGEGYKKVSVYLLNITANLSTDSEINRKRLLEQKQVKVYELQGKKDFPVLTHQDIVIDALFGSGLSRSLEGLAADLVNHINAQTCKARIAVDIPSGLFSNGGGQPREAVIFRATNTLSFQFPKLSFLFPENETCVGDWEVLPIGLHPDFLEKVATSYFYTESSDVQKMLVPRKKFSHKGTYGHALLIAGSYSMMGAAVLSARAAIRAGAGLLTTHVPRLGVDIVQNSVPESLISIDESDILFTEPPSLKNYSAIGIGPGLNQKSNTRKGLQALLEAVEVPLVIDADGLNLLATLDDWKERLPSGTILTPHPREYERLFGRFADSPSRLEHQIRFSRDHACVIVLKGANTCITLPDGTAHFNSTGNPGMAKGGCGDVLTGLILGLLAQGYPAATAAVLGVYVHGAAGDIAAETMGLTGLIPSDLTDNIGKAFYVLENYTVKK